VCSLAGECDIGGSWGGTEAGIDDVMSAARKLLVALACVAWPAGLYLLVGGCPLGGSLVALGGLGLTIAASGGGRSSSKA
jgi:hypothetical protein